MLSSSTERSSNTYFPRQGTEGQQFTNLISLNAMFPDESSISRSRKRQRNITKRKKRKARVKRQKLAEMKRQKQQPWRRIRQKQAMVQLNKLRSEIWKKRKYFLTSKVVHGKKCIHIYLYISNHQPGYRFRLPVPIQFLGCLIVCMKYVYTD